MQAPADKTAKRIDTPSATAKIATAKAPPPLKGAPADRTARRI